MSRIISGAKPTGDLTIGNYYGTMKSWPGYQEQGETLYFVADLHALNARPNPDELTKQSLAIAAWLLALGVDPKRSTIFLESHVPAISELFTILNNYATMGELSRMTQFKDKSQKTGAEGQLVGLFEYPVLMSADILLFDIDQVPLGDDQRQHLELTREITDRFNNLYGEIFIKPDGIFQTVGKRVMDLQVPGRKMSKSDQEKLGYILLVDEPDEIRLKISRAVTDSGDEIKAGKAKPALTNLLEIFSLSTGQSIAQLEAHYQGKSYQDFKNDLADALVNELKPLQAKFKRLIKEPAELTRLVESGDSQANAQANRKIAEIKAKIGLL